MIYKLIDDILYSGGMICAAGVMVSAVLLDSLFVGCLAAGLFWLVKMNNDSK